MIGGVTSQTPALTVRTGPAGTRVLGLGHYQPDDVLTNDDIAQRVDTNDEWIRSRTGIETRHVARDDETVAQMATGAARMALADAGVDPLDVDLVVVATATAKDISPNTSGRVAFALRTGELPVLGGSDDSHDDLRGVVGPGVIDVNTACSGFSYAVGLADQAIRGGGARTAVVVGAEKLTSVTDWTDRSTCILTADGAGAVVLQGTDTPGVGPTLWGSEPQLTEAVRIEQPSGHFRQDGRAVFRWAITQAADRARRIVEASGLTLDDIEVLAAHQANLRIVEPLAKTLGLEDKIVLSDVVESGNTSAASIPLGLSKWWHAGRVPSGVPALLFGFGGGFTWAGQVLVTPER